MSFSSEFTRFFEPVEGNNAVAQLLTRHKAGKRGVFIVHLDRTPLKEKRKAFLFNLGLNAVFAALLVWRFLSGKGRYLPLILPGDMGLMDRSGSRPSQSFSELLWTFVHIAIDSIIAVFCKSFLLPFITGLLWMRLRFGFRETEVVFRVPTQNVALEDLAKLTPEARVQRFTEWTVKAIDKKHIETCPGDFMALGIWQVDYAAAIDAYRMMGRGGLREEDLEVSVWQLNPQGEWMVWKVAMD